MVVPTEKKEILHPITCSKYKDIYIKNFDYVTKAFYQQSAEDVVIEP